MLFWLHSESTIVSESSVIEDQSVQIGEIDDVVEGVGVGSLKECQSIQNHGLRVDLYGVHRDIDTVEL